MSCARVLANCIIPLKFSLIWMWNKKNEHMKKILPALRNDKYRRGSNHIGRTFVFLAIFNSPVFALKQAAMGTEIF